MPVAGLATIAAEDLGIRRGRVVIADTQHNHNDKNRGR